MSPAAVENAGVAHATVTVAQQYLERLQHHGVRYLFGNAGTDFPPLIEAFSKGNLQIRPMLVPHENVAVALAYGVTLITGKPQVVMVHVGLGTANSVCGLFNATRQHIPMILTAGRTPILEHGRRGARNNYINWAQEMFDQASMVRELVKWDYELRDPAQVDEVVDRAFAAAQSAPAGPVYLVLPREVLAADSVSVADAGCGVQDPIRPGLPAVDDLARCRAWLGTAQRPLIVTSDAGRTRAGFEALTALSQRLRIPVVQYRPRFLSLPCSADTHAGYDPRPWLKAADLIMVIDSDVPWLPGPDAPPEGTKIVHIGMDPLYLRYPMRSFRADLTLPGDTAQILEHLDQVPLAHAEVREHWLGLAASGGPDSVPDVRDQGLSHRYVSGCIARAMDDDCVLVNEYPFVLEELNIQDAGRYFAHSPAGGLGWALGAAMGIRLAQPEKTVFAAVGDGSYMFANPTPAHFTSRAHGLPFITVIYNNRRWAAVHRATLSVYPDGSAAQTESPVFATLEPAPDYECVVRACGGLGLRVTQAHELPDAIEQAKHAVRVEGRQAVINVLTQIDYGRSS